MSPHQQFGHETAFYVQLIRQSHTTDFVSLKKMEVSYLMDGCLKAMWIPLHYMLFNRNIMEY
jgi:hypothetical protein